ncbi:hypothetical protein QBC47DRAFT_81501 [Echria macrotheca]|uniref:Cell cycle control protein n=1 Tax=Echria macrotheca TaxID=438768 RepID=A0AAJ0F7R1_9PEZI|nr:hypothetical protein QBC47DRAFT_81501 [Echria macrotheca]
MADSGIEFYEPDANQPDDSEPDYVDLYDSEVDDLELDDSELDDSELDDSELDDSVDDGSGADNDEDEDLPAAPNWLWEASIGSPLAAHIFRGQSLSSQPTSDSAPRSDSEAGESRPQSSGEGVQLFDWPIHSQSGSEIPSSPDSLFVDQVDHDASALDQETLERIGGQIRQQTTRLRQQHAELVQFREQLQRTLNSSQPAGRQRAPPSPIQRRHRGQAEPASPGDELVEMEVGARNRRGNRVRGPGGPEAGSGAAVIDLTEEPDSPGDVVVLPNPDNNIRNRGGRSRNNATPSLARRDNSILGAPVPVIDLTNMDDDEPAPARRAPRNRPGHAAFEIQRHRAEAIIDLLRDEDEAQGVGDALFGIVRRTWNIRNGLEFGLFQRILSQPGEMERPNAARNNNNNRAVPNPLGENLPNFNYGANGYNNRAAKPPYVPPPPAPEGFTRNTTSDQVAVCPNCDEELKYDPDEDKGPPAKKARTKKDREEHHFWVVKECGHVFCRACYEDRKVTAKNMHKTKFRQLEKKTFCNVDGCDSDVTAKSAWVGLFV